MAFIRKIKKKSGIYLAKVEGYRVNGKVKQRVIQYLGKEINGKPEKKVYKSDIEAIKVKRSLDILTIHKLAEFLNITNIKNKHFLSLVYSHLLEKKSINKMEEWMRYTEIPELLKIDANTAKLYDSLTSIENFDKIESEIFNILKPYEKNPKAAIIDVTDTYFEGKNIEGRRRRGKDQKIKHLIQIGLAVTFTNGFPIFHKTYHGNLHNFDIYKDMAIELEKHNISSIILDRGMLSMDNLKLSLKMNLELIAGLKKSKKISEEFLSRIDREKIYTMENRVKLKNTSVFVQSFDYMNGKLIAVYNPALEVIKKEINFEKGRSSDKFIGYSLIYHNTGYTDKEVVRKYYEKDTVERAFKQLKGVLNLRPVRVWLKDHVEGHVKICYLAYAILSLMNYRLRKIGISGAEALNILKHGYKVTMRDKNSNTTWDTRVALEPKQKEILKLLDCCV